MRATTYLTPASVGAPLGFPGGQAAGHGGGAGCPLMPDWQQSIPGPRGLLVDRKTFERHRLTLRCFARWLHAIRFTLAHAGRQEPAEVCAGGLSQAHAAKSILVVRCIE